MAKRMRLEWNRHAIRRPAINAAYMANVTSVALGVTKPVCSRIAAATIQMAGVSKDFIEVWPWLSLRTFVARGESSADYRLSIIAGRRA